MKCSKRTLFARSINITCDGNSLLCGTNLQYTLLRTFYFGARFVHFMVVPSYFKIDKPFDIINFNAQTEETEVKYYWSNNSLNNKLTRHLYCQT